MSAATVTLTCCDATIAAYQRRGRQWAALPVLADSMVAAYGQCQECGDRVPTRRADVPPSLSLSLVAAMGVDTLPLETLRSVTDTWREVLDRVRRERDRARRERDRARRERDKAITQARRAEDARERLALSLGRLQVEVEQWREAERQRAGVREGATS